jgi:hypothetical protein
MRGLRSLRDVYENSGLSVRKLRNTQGEGQEFAGVYDMDLEIREEPVGSLREHAEIPIAFLVDRILEVSVSDGGLGGIILQESAVDVAYVNDYDAIRGEGPTRWPKRFDVTNWGLIAAYQSGIRVGGAVVAFKTPNLEMLGDQSGVAAL